MKRHSLCHQSAYRQMWEGPINRQLQWPKTVSRSSVLRGHREAPHQTRSQKHSSEGTMPCSEFWMLVIKHQTEELGWTGCSRKRGRTTSKASRPEPVCLMGNPQQFWVAEQNHGRELGWEMTLKIKEDLKEWQKAYTLFCRGEWAMTEFNPERVTIRIVFSSLLDKSLNYLECWFSYL